VFVVICVALCIKLVGSLMLFQNKRCYENSLLSVAISHMVSYLLHTVKVMLYVLVCGKSSFHGMWYLVLITVLLILCNDCM